MKKTSKIDRLLKCFWLKSGEVHEDWDTLLQKLIERGNVTSYSEYVVVFDNDFEVWIGNHPYSSGHLRRYKGEEPLKEIHCSKDTLIKLEDFYYSKVFRSQEGEIDKAIKEHLNSL